MVAAWSLKQHVLSCYSVFAGAYCCAFHQPVIETCASSMLDLFLLESDFVCWCVLPWS